MAAARPFFSGKPSCVRSSACTWLFSSQHSTSACSGGDMYRPTMSSSFSTNCGSRETLKPRIRCGFKPLARQCRETLAAHRAAGLARCPRAWIRRSACANGKPALGPSAGTPLASAHTLVSLARGPIRRHLFQAALHSLSIHVYLASLVDCQDTRFAASSEK